MNIVLCDKNCKYQKDGYCNINHTPSIINTNNNECPYFSNKNDNNETNSPKPSLLDSIQKTN